jgi:hypothetical protein
MSRVDMVTLMPEYTDHHLEDMFTHIDQRLGKLEDRLNTLQITLIIGLLGVIAAVFGSAAIFS